MAAEVAPPLTREVIDDDDEVRMVAAWADRQRALLADLAAELAQLRASTGRGRSGAADDPSALVPVLEEILDAGARRLAALTADAIAAADRAVADAVERATEAVVAAGLRADLVRPRDPLAGLALSHRSPRRAEEIWRDLVAPTPRRRGWSPPRHPAPDGAAS